MTKLYAQAGKLWIIDKKATKYDCGSFIAEIRAGSAEEILISGLHFDQSDFHEERFLIFLLNKFKKIKVKNIIAKLTFRPKKVIKSLVDGHVLLEGIGNDEKEAIRDILDKASFWARVYPGSTSEKLLNVIPEYFFASNNPQTLSSLENRILNLLTKKTIETAKMPASKLHRMDMYKKHYITMDVLEKVFKSEGITRDEIYVAVERLYNKHCIIFQDKVPFYSDYKESLFESLFGGIFCLSLGKDMGLGRPVIPFEEFLEEEFKKGNLQEWLKGETEDTEEDGVESVKEIEENIVDTPHG